MPNLNANRLREFIKCIEPMGREFTFSFDKDGLEVKAMNGSNDAMCFAAMDFDPGFMGDIGVSTETFGKLMPKGIDNLTIEFGKETTIEAPGYKAKMLSVNAQDCCRQPKKYPNPEPKEYIISPQLFYERLTSLKSAFEGLGFVMDLDPTTQGMITFSDCDSSIGEMKNSLVITTPIEKKFHGMFPYETLMPCLNAVRLICQTVVIQFMPLPSNDAIAALVVKASSAQKDLPLIEVTYVIAPRVET